jgi:hypothetical protein
MDLYNSYMMGYRHLMDIQQTTPTGVLHWVLDNTCIVICTYSHIILRMNVNRTTLTEYEKKQEGCFPKKARYLEVNIPPNIVDIRESMQAMQSHLNTCSGALVIRS